MGQAIGRGSAGVVYRLFFAGGVDAQNSVRRAPAQQAGQHRNQAQPCPRALGADKGKAEDNQTNDDAQNTFSFANVTGQKKTPRGEG